MQNLLMLVKNVDLFLGLLQITLINNVGCQRGLADIDSIS